MDRVSCRGGLPSCSGRTCCGPFQSVHRNQRLGRRRASQTKCDAAWSEVVVAGLHSVSSSVQNASNVLATVSPSFLQPTVNILGSDVASTIALTPSWQGLSRLAVSFPAVAWHDNKDALPHDQPCYSLLACYSMRAVKAHAASFLHIAHSQTAQC